MPRKPKTQQSKSMTEVSGRDLFQTPRYAVELIVPFLKELKLTLPGKMTIWEPAAGLGKIVRCLQYWGFKTYGSDLDSEEYPKHNFLTQANGQEFDCIVTNTPFSLKKEFYHQCLSYQRPFALLIPADYSGWIIKAVQDGAEKIIPTRRIDYITPNTLQRIWEGEMFESLNLKCTFQEFKDSKRRDEWEWLLNRHREFKFDSIYDAPAKLLRKYSSSYYHSMWLTWGFNLGRTETFVELTNNMKDNI